jgi:hypothetical protein
VPPGPTKIIRMLDTFAVAVAVLTFGTAALTFGTGIRNSRKLDDQHGTLSEIRVNVNGRLDALAQRVEQLVIALAEAGEPVPPDSNGNGGSAHPPTDDETGERLDD